MKSADRLRIAKLASGGDERSVIEARCETISRHTAALGLLNPLRYYGTLLDRLVALPNTEIVPIGSITQVPREKPLAIALRHDVDADIVTAVRCGRMLASRGLPGAFFILHTSHYYGVFQENEGDLAFVRHDGFTSLLADLRATGAEIGIHNDALGIIHDHGADGVQAFVEELRWLREQGVAIRGSAAHNSAAVYGAECFEIFKGLATGNRGVVHWRGRSIHLQTLAAGAIGLEYEANHPRVRDRLDLSRIAAISTGEGDLLRDPVWQRAYFLDHPVFDRGYTHDAWLIGADRWILAGGGTVRYPLDLDGLVDALSHLPAGSRVVISVHPIYVGLRTGDEDQLAPPPPDGDTPVSAPVAIEAVELPESFGFWWEREESDLNWYDWMFHYRLRVHRAFIAWLAAEEASHGRFASVLEVGCGRGVFYPHFFADRAYTGLEYSRRNVDWLIANREWPSHAYHQGDIARWKGEEKHDLVFSSGTIDNVQDMDAFLEGMVRGARKAIYLTAYRGWFPELTEHRVSYSAETGAFYNDISPARVRQVLERLGCRNIVVEALPTGLPTIPFETLIVAAAPSVT